MTYGVLKGEPIIDKLDLRVVELSSEGKRHSGNGIWSHIGMNALLGPRSGANTVCSYQYTTQAHISELDKLCVILRDPLS